MLFENVMAILNKCRDEDLNDVLVARDMLISENAEKVDDIRDAGKFLSTYYHQITKCNRLGLIEKINEICDAKDDKNKLNDIFNELKEIDG